MPEPHSMLDLKPGSQFEPIYDTKLAIALLTCGVNIPEPVALSADRHPSGKLGWYFNYDPNQPIAEIEPGAGDTTAGVARRCYEDFQYCRFHPEALTSQLRFALESYQRINKFINNSNKLIQTITPTGTTRHGPDTVFTAESLMLRQRGDGDVLIAVRMGRSYYLVRKTERAQIKV